MDSGTGTSKMVVSKQEPGVDGWSVFIDSDTKAGAVELNNGDGKITGKKDLRDGVDHLVTFTIPDTVRSNWKLYLDGEDSSVTLGGSDTTLPTSTTVGFEIGSRASSALHFDGNIFLIYFHNRSLSAEEVGILHNDPFIIFRPDSFDYWNPAAVVAANSAGRWLHTIYED